MVRTTLAVVLLTGIASQAAVGQEFSLLQRQTWPTASPISRIDSILNEASPSDWLASSNAHNPRSAAIKTGITGIHIGTGRTINPQTNHPQTHSVVATDLPISANIKLDDEEHLQAYMKEYEVKRLIQQRAQRERDLRQLRMETQKFYGISTARPDASAMMFGGMYAPNWLGGHRAGYGFRGPYPRQQLVYQYHQ